MSGCPGVMKTVNIAFFFDTINIVKVRLYLIVALSRLSPVIPLLVTLITSKVALNSGWNWKFCIVVGADLIQFKLCTCVKFVEKTLHIKSINLIFFSFLWSWQEPEHLFLILFWDCFSRVFHSLLDYRLCGVLSIHSTFDDLDIISRSQ